MSVLQTFREAKDVFFRDDPDSPLTAEQHREFGGLRYYDEAPEFVFEVRAEPFEEPEMVDLQTSTGDTQSYLRWARAAFEVDGSPAELTIFREASNGALFLPFQDANAGGETYGAGRYLEPDELDGGMVHIDFNYSYNPYCAYNDEWSCPLPPPENRLRVAIRAGEQTFRDEH